MEAALGEMQEWIDLAGDKSDNARPRFYLRPVYMRFESEKQGNPVYKDVEYVEIHVPGEIKNIVDRKVRDADKERWRPQYAAFKAQESKEFGTPIHNLPNLHPSQIALMQHINIRSIEDLASLTDSGLETLGPGARELQKMATAYLEKSDDRDNRLAEENATLKTQMLDLEAKLNQLIAAQGQANEAQATKAEAPTHAEDTAAKHMALQDTQEPPKKRGRPPKK